jgi:glycosyltransferase involved in cell wall biosynthesis
LKIIRYYPRARSGDGGMTNAVRCWSQAACRHGHDVTIVYHATKPEGETSANGIKWIGLPHRGTVKVGVPVGFREIVVNADVLVLHSGWTAHNTYAARIARTVGVPYILEPRGAYDPNIVARNSFKKRIWWSGFERSLLQNAAAIHVFFQEEEAHVRALGYVGRIIVSPNGVTTPHGVQWDGGSDGHVLWMGRFDPDHKGLWTLIEAVRLISPSERPIVSLYGPEWRDGKERVKARVHELGLNDWIRIEPSVHGTDKFQLMARARAFVYPSQWEAFGNSVAESASIGVPTLVTPYPLGKYLSERGGAVLCAAEPAALADGLRRVCADGAADIGAKALTIMRSEFTWESVSRKWIAQAEAVLQTRRSVAVRSVPSSTDQTADSAPSLPTLTERGELLLSLVQELSAHVPRFVVWKNVESALTGTGDIDASSSPDDWTRIEEIFRNWVEEHHLGTAVVCNHIPGGLNLFAVSPRFSTIFEMGVKADRIWRGASLFTHTDLQPLVISDARSFRRIRLGAEGLFKLLLNGINRDGTPDIAAMKTKRVRELICQDRPGACQAVVLCGLGKAAALRLVDAVIRGDWDRRAALELQTWFLVKAILAPGTLGRRVAFRMRGIDECRLVAVVQREHRIIPQNRKQFLAEVACNHRLYPARS